MAPRAVDHKNLPRPGDAVSIYIPTLSPTSITTFVTYREGGTRRNKVLIRCMAGPQDHYGCIQVYWKQSTGWFCWLLGKRYAPVQVEHV